MSNPDQVILSYNFFNELLLNAGLVNTPSHLHGYLTGWVCGSQGLDAKQVSEKQIRDNHIGDNQVHNNQVHDNLSNKWRAAFETFTDLGEFDEPFSDDQFEPVLQLYISTLNDLSDPNLAFDLLLPDDTCALNRRAQELGIWCQGLLAGLVESGVNVEKALGEASVEGLTDLAKIAQVDDIEEDDESAEKSLLEAAEYVRVVTLTIFTELNALNVKTQPTSGSSTLH